MYELGEILNLYKILYLSSALLSEITLTLSKIGFDIDIEQTSLHYTACACALQVQNFGTGRTRPT